MRTEHMLSFQLGYMHLASFPGTYLLTYKGCYLADIEHFLQTVDILSPSLCVFPESSNSWEFLMSMATGLDQSLWTVSELSFLKKEAPMLMQKI